MFRADDGWPVFIRAIDPDTGDLVLEDGTIVPPEAVDDPLWSGRQRDMQRGRIESERLRWIRARDFDALFPYLRRRRRAQRLRRIGGWLCAGLSVGAAALCMVL
ncbi:MAG: hypothetical protein R3F62_20575 [Planctomycetota bacterium]